MAETASQSADSSARIGLHFNGASGSYITLPKEILAGRTAFSVSMDFATTQNTGSSRIYNRPCLIGIDTSGYTSGDWHIDTKNGNLHLFDGMGASGSYGSSVTWDNGDIGYDTGVKVNDGKKHNVKLVDDGAKFTIFVDGKECEEHPTVSKNCDEKNGITIACSRPGECVYSEMTLYALTFYDGDGKEIAKYEPTKEDYEKGVLTDSVGSYSASFDKSKVTAKVSLVTVSLAADIKRDARTTDLAPIYQTYGITPCNDVTKSKTGYAFHYASRIKRFHIPEDVKEIWVRFDIWRATNASRWRAFNQSSDEFNGVTYEDNAIHFWSSANKGHTIKSVSGTDEELTGLHSYVLHMKCGEADGVIECWRDNKLLASVTNTKVRPKGFNNFFLQSDDTSCLFSDVIVADYALTCDDHATADDEADRWQQPSLTENGTAGGDKMAVWASFDSDAYKAFKDGYTSYLNRFNTNEGINCWIPEEIHINHIALMSSDGYIPSHGIVYGSDDNKTWTQIGKWDEASSNSVVTASVNDGGHVYHYFSVHPTSGTDFHSGNADVTSISIMANLASKSKPSDVPKKTPTEDPHTVAFDTDVERNSEVSAETLADIQRTGELDLTPHDVSLKADIKRFAAGLVEAYADIKRKARDTERDITPRERELMTKVMTGDSLKKLFIYLRDFFTAPKAKCDEDGNSIKNTYQKIDEKAKTAELADKAAIAEFCSGNALSADNAKKLSTRRAITLSGDIEGTASFDGSSDITINTVAKISTDKVDKLQKDMTSGFAQTDMNLANLKTELQNETDTKVSSAVTTTKNDFDAKIENTKSELSNNLSETVAKNVDAYHASIFRQPSTSHAVGDVVYVKGAGAKYRLACVTAGTTSADELMIPSGAKAGDGITDGTATWKVEEIEGMITAIESDGGLVTLTRVDGSTEQLQIVANNAGAHNAVYRGKDLTAYFDSGEMSKAIAAGTFKDIYPGDYITKSVTVNGTTYSDVKWMVGDLDYFLGHGDTSILTQHHVLMFPDTCLGNSYMNPTNTTEGAYMGSYMYKTMIPLVNAGIQTAFGTAHVVSHRELMSKIINATMACASGNGWTGSTYWGSGEWADVLSNLFTENMVYGANIFSSSPQDVCNGCRQVAAFRHDSSLYIGGTKRESWWLRAVAHSTAFAAVSGYGYAGCDYASIVLGVRPYFLLS